MRANQVYVSLPLESRLLICQNMTPSCLSQTYCGYYKHNLASGLVGAELMLEAMGYKHTDPSTMVLETPVDPDRVNMVSKDSLVALVELQVI